MKQLLDCTNRQCKCAVHRRLVHDRKRAASTRYARFSDRASAIRFRINSTLLVLMVLIGAAASIPAFSSAQGINIDLDVFFGDPELGNGAPSSSFGGAGAQPGFWNRVSFGSIHEPLVDITGQQTAAVMTVESSGSFSGTGFRNKSNTGDFALLLNDAV